MEAPPLDQQGLQGFAMPDPYGLSGFTDSLLPNDPDPEEVLEALHLCGGGGAEEAYPPCRNGLLPTNYKLERDRFRLKANTIFEYLRRQAFVTHPAPPRNESFQSKSAFGRSYVIFVHLANSP